MNSGEIEQRLIDLEARVAALESPASPVVRSEPSKKALSIKEFLIDKAPKTANDHVAAIAYFLEVVSGQAYFTAEDVRNAFRAAKVIAPKNINDAINKNIAKGFIMESGEKIPVKAWVLTARGETYVESGFGD